MDISQKLEGGIVYITIKGRLDADSATANRRVQARGLGLVANLVKQPNSLSTQVARSVVGVGPTRLRLLRIDGLPQPLEVSDREEREEDEGTQSPMRQVGQGRGAEPAPPRWSRRV